MRKRPLLLALCVFWLGIVFRNTYMNTNPVPIASKVYGMWPVIVFLVICIYDLKPLKKRFGRGVLLLLIFLLGMVCMNQNMIFRENYLSKLTDGDEVTIWGEVYKCEYLDEKQSRIYLDDCYVDIRDVVSDSGNDSQTHIPCNRIMAYVSSADYQAGKILKIKGQFHNFKVATNDGAFDSRSFYQSQKIDFYVEAESVAVLGDALNPVEKWILDLQESIGDVYEESLPAKWAGVMKGIVLGDKAELEDDIKTLFTASGIVHILTVSGLHVSVLGRGFYQFLRKRGLGFLFSGIAATIVLLGYGYLTGNGISTLRAIGMMLLFMLAQLSGRSYDMLNALGGVCLFLLWENPFLVEYTGLWFSVTALLGVGWSGKYLSEKAGILKVFWMSLGITLMSLPVVAYCYFEVPLYSTLLNCMVIPLLTPVFICGVLGGIVGLFLPGVGKVLLYPCHFILWIYEGLCEWVSGFPFATAITGKPPGWLIVLYYLVMGIGLLWVKKQDEQERGSKKSKRTRSLWIKKLAVGLICFGILLGYQEEKTLEINFLDVGQGDGIHISVEGNDFFIDGGSVDVSNVGKYRLLPYLKANGISDIDYWFVTHADTDHISGLLEVMESGYKIQNIVLSYAMPKDEKYEILIASAEKAGVELCYMNAGDVIRCGDGVFRCLYPSVETIDGILNMEDRNEASLVLELTYENYKALFTGDISSEVEAALINQGLLSDVWLYKAAHHGSKNSNSLDFLAVICPEVTVISCSSTNVYGHPHTDTLERLEAIGCEVWSTAEWGRVKLEYEKGTIYLNVFR